MDMSKLIEENLGIAKDIAKRFADTSDKYEYDDFLSMANIGLMKASKKYDKSKGVKFSTYSYTACKNEIIKTMTRDKYYNYTQGNPIELDMLPVSLNVRMEECKDEGGDAIDSIEDNYGDDKDAGEVIDFIERVIRSKQRNTKKGLEIAERNMNVVKDYIIHGYDYAHISRRRKIRPVMICQIIKGFAKDAKEYI